MSIHDRLTSIGRAGLMSLMGDPRYTDADHPEHDLVVDMIRRGFEMVAGEVDAADPLRAAMAGTGAPAPGFATLFQNAAADGRRIDLMNSDARAAFGRGLLLKAIRAESATMPTGLGREDVAGPRFGTPLATSGADGDSARSGPAGRGTAHRTGGPQAPSKPPAPRPPLKPPAPQPGTQATPGQPVSPADPIPPVPAYRDQVVLLPEWRRWHQVLDGLTDDRGQKSLSEAENSSTGKSTSPKVAQN